MGSHRQSRHMTMIIVFSCVAVVTVVALAFTAIRVLSARNADSHTFTPSQAVLVNPNRGWQEPIEDLAQNPDAAGAVPSSITLARTFIRLDRYRDSPLPAPLLNNLGRGLDNAEDKNIRIILRFVYNDGPSQGSKDASLDTILGHIRQLAPVLKAHPGALAAVEAGFVGAWGEWHGSSNGLDTNASAKRDIVAALGKAVPSQTPILLRYPYDILDMQKTWANNTEYKSLLARIGSHQDCFLASDPDDWGTWGQRADSVSADKQRIANLRNAFVGGETCNPEPPKRTNCTTAISEMKLMHFTYLNRRFEPNSLARLHNCDFEIGNRMGYRFVLDTGTWPRTINSATKQLKISLKIRNQGFAAPTMKRQFRIVFARLDTRIEAVLSADIRTLTPGKHTLTITVKLPGNLPRGRYVLYLAGVPDKTNLETAGVFAHETGRNVGIEFANRRVWNVAKQANVLGVVRVK